MLLPEDGSLFQIGFFEDKHHYDIFNAMAVGIRGYAGIGSEIIGTPECIAYALKFKNAVDNMKSVYGASMVPHDIRFAYNDWMVNYFKTSSVQWPKVKLLRIKSDRAEIKAGSSVPFGFVEFLPPTERDVEMYVSEDEE
jgi:hypothetical protein